MPRRSNPFQRLVRTIYEQLASEGVSVRESVLVREEPEGAEREIDILVESDVADSRFRMAVETCDERRPASVGWIDELLGKYGRLRIDKVVAVSRSGFSVAAKEKAVANFIEAKTLDEALEADWPAEMIKIGAAKVRDLTRWEEIGFITEPPLSGPPPLKSMISNELGNELINLGGLLDHCFRQVVVPAVRAAIRSKLKVLADFRRDAVEDFTVTAQQPLFIVDPDGGRHRIEHLTFRTITTFEVERLPVAHHAFGPARISSASAEFDSREGPVRFSFVQTPGRRGARVLITKPGKRRQGRK